MTALSLIAAGGSGSAVLAQDAIRQTRTVTSSVDHSTWDKLLRTYVQSGTDGINRVDFRRFKAEAHGELRSYLSALATVTGDNLDRAEQFAFWINLYNAATVEIVLARYPVASIKDIDLGGGGPWQAPTVNVLGRKMSLDEIEHEQLLKVFKDPRVHYAVNCASLGCPNLRGEAYTGLGLESQLEEAATTFVNHPRGFDIHGKTVKASSIYDWFAADFGGTASAALDHARRYAAPPLQQKLAGITEISEYAYDWGLIDTRRNA